MSSVFLGEDYSNARQIIVHSHGKVNQPSDEAVGCMDVGVEGEGVRSGVSEIMLQHVIAQAN